MFSKDRDFVLTENETLMFKRNRRTPTISDINIHLYVWLSWFSRPACQTLFIYIVRTNIQ